MPPLGGAKMPVDPSHVIANCGMSHDPDGQARVTEACNGVELALDGAGHRLVMTDEQVDAFRRAVEEFVA